MYPNQPITYTGQKSRSWKRLLVIAVLIIILGLIIFGAINKLGASKNESFARDFITKVQTGKADESYAMTSQLFKDNTTQEAWKTSVDKIHAYIGGDLDLVSHVGNTVYDFRPKGKNYVLSVNLSGQNKTLVIDYFVSQVLAKK